MHKRPQPCTSDMSSHGQYHHGKNKDHADNPTKDSENNTLQYFITRQKTIHLLKQKGIKHLYPIQQQTYRYIHQGSDIIARDRTGSGKTMAFVLPVVERFRNEKFEHKYPKFLIILPTRELAMQVNNEIESLRYRDEDDFKSYVVYGKTSIEDNVRRLNEGVDILVATPGRLNDLVERGAVRLDSIEVICLDQADQILKQGFKEEIEKVFSAIAKVNKNKVQTLLFSATIPPWLKDLSQEYQSKNTPYINMISDNDVRTSKTIKHLSVEISRLGEMEVVKLIEEMTDKFGGYEKRILIFCERKSDVDNLSKNLRIQNQPLHGDVPQSRREHAYRNFKSGHLKCIVATNVAARGLDFPHVDLVIQMEPPKNTEEYIHRAGRTGRAGKEGTCLTFFDRRKSGMIQRIEDQARVQIQRVTVDFDRLSSSNNRQYERNDRPERNDRNDRGDRGESGYRGDRGDRSNHFERNDRNDRGQNDRDGRNDSRNDRREFSSNNDRYGGRDRDSSNNNYDRGQSRDQSRDPRPRNTDNYSDNRFRREEPSGQQQRRRSNSGSPVRESSKPQKRATSRSKSRSKSRSFSKDRSTSPRREPSSSSRRNRSPSPRKNSPTKQSSSRQSTSKQDDCDY